MDPRYLLGARVYAVKSSTKDGTILAIRVTAKDGKRWAIPVVAEYIEQVSVGTGFRTLVPKSVSEQK
ncbi:MAG: hypothetical protein JRN21_09595 [Nitrososphaerota archaeon]|nr:hypothetical protein [Nitrososphaerota archaeon]